MLANKCNKLTLCQIHHLDLILQFTNEVCHVNNPITDTLSCIDVSALHTDPVNTIQKDEELQEQWIYHILWGRTGSWQ